ncbi:MAG: transposase [Nitrosomonas sp.]|nr:transposase [Nitrosomonas sp.]MBK6617005.1 transposase [Nitrosomonas sp.]
MLLKRQRDLGPMDEALLSGWVENYPDLYELHKAKEGFCDIWDQHYSRTEAINAFDLWINSIPESVFNYFDGMISTVRNWQIEAFNYFDHRVTNAYTESANNHIKSIAKQGRGYSFYVLRARVLFIGAKHKIRPKPFKQGVAEKTIGYALPDDLFINYSVEIPHEPDIS